MAITIGFRLGIYVFKDAEIVDFAAPYGVFSVAHRFDPELDVFFVSDALRPVQAQAGFTIVRDYSFNERPTMNAFLIPGGAGTRQEMHNGPPRIPPLSCRGLTRCTCGRGGHRSRLKTVARSALADSLHDSQ